MIMKIDFCMERLRRTKPLDMTIRLVDDEWIIKAGSVA